MEIMIDTKHLAALADATLEAFGTASYARSGTQRAAVSEFLQTANPATIKELCEELEQAKADAAHARKMVTELQADLAEAYKFIATIDDDDDVWVSAELHNKARAFEEGK